MYCRQIPAIGDIQKPLILSQKQAPAIGTIGITINVLIIYLLLLSYSYVINRICYGCYGSKGIIGIIGLIIEVPCHRGLLVKECRYYWYLNSIY